MAKLEQKVAPSSYRLGEKVPINIASTAEEALAFHDRAKGCRDYLFFYTDGM
jgi:hypothetical protein